MRQVNRYPQLDSLRGLAALTVVAEHCMRIDPGGFRRVSPGLDWAFTSTPLHLFWAGGNAVLLFFVLSGFVLALQVRGGISYVPFVVHRLFRLQIPYLVAITVAMGLSWWAAGRGPYLSAWFNAIWTKGPTLSDVLMNWSLIGHFDLWSFDPPVWSLVHEMRISLIFPLLAFFCFRYGWRSIMTVPFILLGAPGILLLPHWWSWAFDLSATFLYVPLFVVGILVASDRERIVRFTGRLRLTMIGLTAAMALLLYTYPFWFQTGSKLLHLWVIDTSFITLGATYFIVLTLSIPRLAGWLTAAPLRWLGRISYSLYLTHVLVLLGIVHALSGVIALPVLLLIGVAGSLVAADLFHRGVERPALRMGRRLSTSLMAGERRSGSRPFNEASAGHEEEGYRPGQDPQEEVVA
jgi:peptidoglycan/LPS O-acetylase OafA/YrhL